MSKLSRLPAFALLLGACAVVQVHAQGSAAESIAKYREMLRDGNPSELAVARGEELWKTKRGPKNASLDACDLGLGAGVLKGAYAQLPRYFADTDQVQDFESRLVTCIVNLQGFTREEVVRKPFSGAGERQTDIEVLVGYAAEQSRGIAVNVSQSHPKERASFDRGKQIFYTRGGPYDFSCATCHGADARRIRLQDLPNLENKEDSQRAFTTWPGYRLSQGALRSIQWRLYDCFRQQRFPELIFASPASIDLVTYLGVNANGGKMDAPAIKR